MLFMLDTMISTIGVLLGVAFFTLMERKVMGLMHYRKGPNKVVVHGLSQPIADAMKLLTKEAMKMNFTKMIMFMAGPTTSILLMMLCWGTYNFNFSANSTAMKVLMIMAIMSLTAYGFLLTSWGSNSKYALLGGYRAVAQIISYEVCLVLFMMTALFCFKTYSMEKLQMNQQGLWFMCICAPLFLVWLLLCMAEANRTPFDLAEGESELVSGFNVEYGGGLFALIFISEYGMIMFLSFLTTLLFMGTHLTLLKTFMLCFLFVWTRCAFPRVRYDILMQTAWKTALPMSLMSLMMMTALM
uniref:NADH dehydrogenase subunit 1 n=1 Tax=Blomia tropicalis TaxID=40697 RepID=UPI001FF69E87|nr:NADH dehydrogenase subunit 1 [Blomia tropicalis]UOG85309.1 NADH dehydrogenase subunit 1 [Blomia tropicalis]